VLPRVSLLQTHPATRPETLQKLRQLLARMSETDQTLLHSGTIFRPGWLANKLDGLIAVQRGRKTTFGADSSQSQTLNRKPDGRSAALRAEKLPGALSPWFCRGRAPFLFLCLLGFPGPNHLRMARLVHVNLPLGFSVLLLRRSAIAAVWSATLTQSRLLQGCP